MLDVDDDVLVNVNLIDTEKVSYDYTVASTSTGSLPCQVANLITPLNYCRFASTSQANKNVELRKKKPGYQAYDEFDEHGEVLGPNCYEN